MVVLAGEELVSLVVDLGTHTVRIGYSGDDTPSVVAPAYYGLTGGQMVFGEVALGVPRQAGLEVRPVFSQGGGGLVYNAEALEGLLRWALEGRMQVSSESHPVLLVDSPLWSKEVREEIIGMLFDKFGIPAIFLGRNPVLSAFSSGKHTGLVVDMGASGVTVTPVFDGYVVKSACASQGALGGDALTRQAQAMLQEHALLEHALGALPIEIGEKRAVDLGAAPQYTRRALPAALSASFRSFQAHRVLEDFKESVVQVAEAAPANELDVAMRPPKYYEFPTGFNRNYGFDRFRLGEILFQPGKHAWAALGDDAAMRDAGEEPAAVGLSDMIQRAVQNCDVDLRGAIVANVLLCGGGASLPGLSERLNADLNRMPTFGRVRVQMGSSVNERRHAAWIGGSILASLGSFQQLWLTMAEYREHGASYIERKSP